MDVFITLQRVIMWMCYDLINLQRVIMMMCLLPCRG